MTHISAEIIARLANAVSSLDDARLPDDATLFARVYTSHSPATLGYVPIICSDDQSPDPEQPLTVGDLRSILRPFAIWFT